MNVDIKYEDLSNLKPLGEGAFGKVFRADYIGTDVAVKQCFDIKQVNQDNLPPGWDFDKYLEREVQMLKYFISSNYSYLHTITQISRAELQNNVSSFF
jgi:serine/threonine protein kinase